MNVLHVINNLGCGGAEKLIEQTLPIMNKNKDIQVEVLLLTDDKNSFDKKLQEDEIKINVVPLKKIYSIINIFYIRNFIIKGKYDVIHVHLFPCQYWTALAARLIFRHKPKFITTEHSTTNRRRAKKYFKWVEKVMYSAYDKVVSISKKAQDNLIEWIEPKGSDLGKFVVIENGVDIIKFIEAQSCKKSQISKKINESDKLVCMVGRFNEAKDQGTLIKAISKLPEDIHLLLVGEGPLKVENEKLAKQLKIENRVHFLGFRNDVERILKTSDIVVLSSKWEGLSLASIEGMASGKPFVASRVEGLEEIVKGYGLLFEQGNENELSKLIAELLNKIDFYDEVTKKCLERAKNYDINYMVNKLLSIYSN